MYIHEAAKLLKMNLATSIGRKNDTDTWGRTKTGSFMIQTSPVNIPLLLDDVLADDWEVKA